MRTNPRRTNLSKFRATKRLRPRSANKSCVSCATTFTTSNPARNSSSHGHWRPPETHPRLSRRTPNQDCRTNQCADSTRLHNSNEYRLLTRLCPHHAMYLLSIATWYRCKVLGETMLLTVTMAEREQIIYMMVDGTALSHRERSMSSSPWLPRQTIRKSIEKDTGTSRTMYNQSWHDIITHMVA